MLGFAAHRASLCTVRAIGEILHTRRASILASFAKAALWAVAVSLPLRGETTRAWTRTASVP
ncbi:MAG: hypothetical protein ACYTEZ_11880 [Planctomycetota bacterium]